MDPQVAIEATRAAYEGFRKDFIVGTTVALVVSHLFWVVAYGRLLRRMDAVQDARVADQKAMTDRVAVHMDRSATAIDLLLEAQRRGKL